MIMDRLYGGVCYAGIDTDPDLKYPKGAGRVAFLNQQSYIAAISARFVHLQMSEMDKRVSYGPVITVTQIYASIAIRVLLLAAPKPQVLSHLGGGARGRVRDGPEQALKIVRVSNRIIIEHVLFQAEIKPYVLDDQQCDECGGARCNGKTAPFFCANVMCLQYYCEQCWQVIHSQQGREYHKPLVKEGSERPRAINYPWSHHT